MAFKVTLNGANYVSRSQVEAFEAALKQGAPEREEPASIGTARPQDKAPSKTDTAPPVTRQGGNGSNGAHGGANNGEDRTTTHTPAPTIDYAHVLASLERSLTQAFNHQRETLHVHEQYLGNESSYAAIFAQLMQQQGDLVAQGNASPQQLEATLKVLQSLARSLEQFHDHQTETLSVHGQFLSQQAGYAQAFVTLLQEHYGTVLHGKGNGHSNGNGHHQGNGNGHRGEQHLAAPASPGITDAAPVNPAPPVSQAPEISELSLPKAAAPPVATTAPAVALDVEVLTTDLLAIVSEKTGYPAEMLELDMDMEADLGIDSIKRVEILGALQDQYPELPDVEPDVLAELRTLAQIIDYMDTHATASASDGDGAPAPVDMVSETPAPASDDVLLTGRDGADLDPAALQDDLLAIVSEKTGYPAEMLELDMDMEGDLGIDSIKRVEILGALQDQYPELPDVEPDVLAELRTLGQIIAYMREGVARKKA
jgi:acyl carrier protein